MDEMWHGKRVRRAQHKADGGARRSRKDRGGRLRRCVIACCAAVNKIRTRRAGGAHGKPRNNWTPTSTACGSTTELRWCDAYKYAVCREQMCRKTHAWVDTARLQRRCCVRWSGALYN